MRDSRQAVELDVVLEREFAQPARGLTAQLGHILERGGKTADGRACGFEQLAYNGVALAVRFGCAAFFDLGEAVLQGLDQHPAALGVVQQVVLQIGVALHHPDAQTSPSTSYNMRAERPVRRSSRSRFSRSQARSPSRRITTSRSENEV